MRSSNASHREPSLRCVATASRACRGATEPERPRRAARPLRAAEVPLITPKLSQSLVISHVVFGNDDYRTYSDYMNLGVRTKRV